jgi:hypothetical protein
VLSLVLRPPSRILPGIYAGFATLALTVIVTAVFVGAETTAQGSVMAAGLGSGAFGFFTVARGLAGPVGGALQFARPWLWFTVWAAVGLYDGRYQPMLASALLAVGMAVCYLIGGGIALVRRRA